MEGKFEETIQLGKSKPPNNDLEISATKENTEHSKRRELIDVDAENDPEILDLADKDTDSKNDDNDEQQSEWDRDDNYDSDPEMDGSSDLPDDAEDAYLNFCFPGGHYSEIESSDDEEKRWGKEIEEENLKIMTPVGDPAKHNPTQNNPEILDFGDNIRNSENCGNDALPKDGNQPYLDFHGESYHGKRESWDEDDYEQIRKENNEEKLGETTQLADPTEYKHPQNNPETESSDSDSEKNTRKNKKHENNESRWALVSRFCAYRGIVLNTTEAEYSERSKDIDRWLLWRKDTTKACERYSKIVYASEGFHVCEDVSNETCLVDHTHYIEIEDYVIDLARFAVERYNRRAQRQGKESLTFDRVLRATRQGIIYRLTLECKTGQFYEAKVLWPACSGNEHKLYFLRPAKFYPAILCCT